MPDTMQLLRSALSRMDELGHKMSALEERERREQRETLERADHARYLTSREHLIDVQAKKREYQQRCDDALQPWGERAPMPRADESIKDYRHRLASTMQRRLPERHSLRDMDLDTLPSEAFAIFETQMYPAVAAAADQTDSVATDELREVTRINPRNGYKEVHFLGRDSFVKQMMRPGRRVISFLNNRSAHGFPPMCLCAACRG